MELGAFIALGPTRSVLGLSGTELAEIFSCLGSNVFEELEFDAAEGFT